MNLHWVYHAKQKAAEKSMWLEKRMKQPAGEGFISEIIA
jgi:hypothetical protein